MKLIITIGLEILILFISMGICNLYKLYTLESYLVPIFLFIIAMTILFLGTPSSGAESDQ